MSLLPETHILTKSPNHIVGLITPMEGVIVCRPAWMLEAKVPIFSSLGRWEVLTPEKRKDHNHYLHPWQNNWLMETTLFGGDPNHPGLRFSFGWNGEPHNKDAFLDRIKREFPQDFLWLTLHPEVFRGHFYEEEEIYDEDF